MFSKKSPNFARRGHQQIKQDGVDEEDKVVAGVEYTVQYMGSIEVASGCGTGSGNTDMPVAVFMAQSKSTDKKSKKTMFVTHKSLTVKDDADGRLIASFPISKVTYCNVDATYEKAFVFVARERKEKPFKAYIFLCDTKAKAQEVFKTVSLAFKMNYESFQATAIREASLRSQARTGLDDDIETHFHAHESNGHDLNQLQNGDAELALPNGSALNANELAVPSSSQNYKAIDKTVEYLQNCRIRSNTDPTSGSHLTSASVCSDEDFDEFMQLAKSRSRTIHSASQLQFMGAI